MTEDESVREALLELQFLREREAETLAETRSLLACLEGYSSADTATSGQKVLFDSLKAQTGASLLLLAERDGGPRTAKIVASSLRGLSLATVTAPIDLFAKPRNLSNLHAAGTWSAPFDMGTLGAALVVPGKTADHDVALLAFKPKPDMFTKSDLRLAERLAGLVSRAQDAIEVEAQNALLSAAIEGSSSGFSISDAQAPDKPLVYVNKAFEAITGYSPTEVLGRNCRFMSADDKDSPERVRLRSVIAHNQPGTFLLRNKKKDGQIFWNGLSIFPVTAEGGTVTHLVATQTDVTPRINAQKERDRMRTQMEQALTATEDSFLILDEEQRVVFANDAIHDLFYAPDLNWDKGTFFSENWDSYLTAAQDMPGRITGLLKAPDLFALAKFPSGREINLPDGRVILIRSALLPDGGLTLSATNVTQLKAAQALLSQRLAAIEAAGDGIAISDKGGRLVYANSACVKMLGFARNTAALGKHWFQSYPALGATAQPDDLELTLQRTQDAQLHTHEITLTPLQDGGFVIVFRDVTQTVETESREQEMQSNLQRLQREQATAQLTAGIAHDFNNLLSAINGSTALIGMDPNVPASIQPHLDRISKAGQQSAGLINRLLDVGDVQTAQGAFGLVTSLADVETLLAPSIPAQIALNIETPLGAPVLAGDSGAFSQVLTNLLLNAKDAIGAKPGEIRVSFDLVSGDEAPELELLAGQSYARIDVADTGPGMSPETQKSVFEPYFTTKGRKGTGLGLAMVAMQMRAVKGAVQVHSLPGAGATFSVFWPLANARAPTPVIGSDVTQDLSGMTIIVVDDDSSVGTVISEYLEAFGAEVATCEDPHDALEAVREDPGAWSAVVTDYDMPGMNGGALAEAIKQTSPDLPIVLVTALARRLSDPRLTPQTITKTLAKPVNLDQLVEVLASTRNAS